MSSVTPQKAEPVYFPIHDKETAPPQSHPLLGDVEGTFGSIFNVLAVMAESPTTLEGYLSLTGIFKRSNFTEQEQQFILLVISRLNECHYCTPVHTANALRLGMDEAVTTAIREDRPFDDARLEALRTFITIVVENRGWATQEEMRTFLDVGFTRRDIMDVVLAISLKTLSNFINHMAETRLDAQLEPYRWTPPAKS